MATRGGDHGSGEAGLEETHWTGCWRAHHECAVILLERILASAEWEADCAELGCTEAEHSSRTIRTLSPPTGGT